MKTISIIKSSNSIIRRIKATVLGLFLISLTSTSYAQLSQYIVNQDNNQNLYDIKAGMEPYIDSLESAQDSATFYAEGGEYIEYKKFMTYWEPRLYPHGDFTRAFDTDSMYYTNNQNNYTFFSDKPWHEVGPFDKPDEDSFDRYGVGPVEYLSIYDDGTPDSANSKYMLVASLLGGVFYSTDYGETWNSTATDTQWGQSGSSCAIFYPTDHTTWFASSSGNSNSGYSLWIGKTGGIYRTNDEGTNWDLIADRYDLGGIWTKVFNLLILPDNPNVLFAVTSSGIFKSVDCEAPDPAWEKVMDGLAFDIELKPGSSSTLYATAFINDEAWKVMKSDNSGDVNTWAELEQQPQLIESSDFKQSSFTIEVSKAKPDYLYCLANQSFNANLYYFDLANATDWTKVNSSTIATWFGQGHAFAVEQVEHGEDIIVSRYTKMRKFNINTLSNGDEVSQHHADVEDILYHPYNAGELWACTHGGVEKSTDVNGDFDNWQTKYNGLGVANVEEMATSPTNPGRIMIGLYHDGTQLTRSQYSENWNPDWALAMGGDGMRPMINPFDPDKVWASAQNGSWKYSNDYFVQNSQSMSKSTHFGTEGVLNKVTPSIMYRHAYFNPPSIKLTEVYARASGQDQLISSFRLDYPDTYLIIGVYTPSANGNHLLITIKDQATGEFFLHRTTNVNATPQNVQWTELIIPRNNGAIATIDFDPYDENIIYLVYSNSTGTGDYSTEMVYKIDYTDPLNPQTDDLTNNLPNTSTGKDCIEIDNGGTRGIYLYTEYGIFYTNNDLIDGGFDCWQKFGKELPHTRAGSLEINYVCNKLRAGLYGRGVWEIPLPCITDRGDVTLNANETWTEETRIGGIVTIEQDVELSILNTTISFGDDAKIIVKPGAKLIIDGATLTNACSEMWPGIEVWGNKSAHQYPDANGNYQQGYVELRNEAVIENAWEAIQPWKPEDFQKTGGIIVANGAIFKNNRRAVQFISYQNYNPTTGDPRPNQCIFRNCTFETNEDFDELFGVSPFSTFISMWKVNGVEFLGCDFIDSRAAFQDATNIQAVGIWTIDANFSVLPRCVDAYTTCWNCTQNNLDFSSFTGLNIGVYTSQHETMNSFLVDRTDFINNLNGIVNLGNDFPTCNRSVFVVGTKQTSGNYEWPIGILNSHSVDLTFDQNDFSLHSGVPSDLDGTIGIWNSSTGEDINIVFNNSFTGFDFANMASGDNHGNLYPELGLQYRCNQNTANKQFDFYVGWQNHEGIATIQGTPANPAGNTFSHNTTPNGSDFSNIALWPVNYYYYTGNPNEVPLNTIGVWPKGTINQNNCTDRFGAGSDIRLTEAQKNAYRQQYYDNMADYNNTKALYESLKDGGDTPGTKTDIETSWPDETWALRAQLLADSPHLTQEVLREAAVRTDVLPHTIMFEICIANPEEMRNESFLDFLATKEDPMPQYMIDDLRDGADENTYKSVLQNEMAAYAYLWGDACTNLLRDIVLDSTGIQYDSLRLWLGNKESLHSAYQIVNSYLAEDDFTNALTYLNAIPDSFNLSAKQFEEYGYFHDLKTTIITARQQGRNIMQLDSLEVLDLVVIADTSKGLAGAQAQSLLNFAYGYNYFESPDISSQNMKETRVQNQWGEYNNIAEKPHFVMAYPNPANQWVTFDYTLPPPAEKAMITITDVSGRQIGLLKVNRSFGQTVWDTSGTPSGIYFYSLSVNGNIIDKRKLIISK